MILFTGSLGIPRLSLFSSATRLLAVPFSSHGDISYVLLWMCFVIGKEATDTFVRAAYAADKGGDKTRQASLFMDAGHCAKKISCQGALTCQRKLIPTFFFLFSVA